MSASARLLSILALLLDPATAFPVARAQESASIQLASGISYQLLARWDVERLNRVLETDIPAFVGISTSYTPARNAVRLYRITYPSVIPEQGNRPITASVRLAVPDTGETSFPMVSYQHGTVYYRMREVPSFSRSVDRDPAMNY